ARARPPPAPRGPARRGPARPPPLGGAPPPPPPRFGGGGAPGSCPAPRRGGRYSEVPWTRRPVRRRRPRRPCGTARPRVEALEVRTLLTAALGPNPPVPLPEAEPNDVITQAQDLGALNILPVEVAGRVGNSPAR